MNWSREMCLHMSMLLGYESDRGRVIFEPTGYNPCVGQPSV